MYVLLFPHLISDRERPRCVSFPLLLSPAVESCYKVSFSIEGKSLTFLQKSFPSFLSTTQEVRRAKDSLYYVYTSFCFKLHSDNSKKRANMRERERPSIETNTIYTICLCKLNFSVFESFPFPSHNSNLSLFLMKLRVPFVLSVVNSLNLSSLIELVLHISP